MRRYERSLETLSRVLPKADYAWLYDNSSREGFRLVLRTVRGEVRFQIEELPGWTRRALGR
ncbi:MAG: hypothetical protein C4332_10955 [Meiothermus sp.]